MIVSRGFNKTTFCLGSKIRSPSHLDCMQEYHETEGQAASLCTIRRREFSSQTNVVLCLCSESLIKYIFGQQRASKNVQQCSKSHYFVMSWQLSVTYTQYKFHSQHTEWESARDRLELNFLQSSPSSYITAVAMTNGLLTHLPLVLHICVSESGQYWFR